MQFFFGWEILWNWLTSATSSEQGGIEFDSNPGPAVVGWCESECDCLFVSLWPCDNLSTCRGCNPTFPLHWLRGSSTPECTTNNRPWLDGFLLHLFTSFVEFLSICGNIWLIVLVSPFLFTTAPGSRGDQRPTRTNNRERQHGSRPRGQVLWYLDQEVLHACFIAGCNSNRDRGT